jgi:GAF domain-containing protein/CheY-like chemotaxis protein
VGDGHDEPRQAAPGRGAALNRREAFFRRFSLTLAAIAAAVAVLWAVGGDAVIRHEPFEHAFALAVAFVAAAALLTAAVRYAAPAPDPEIERRSRELETLYSAAITMASSPDLPTLAEHSLDVMLSVARVDAARVYRVDPDRCHLLLVASRGLTAERIRRVRKLQIAGNPLGDAARDGRVTLAYLDSAGGQTEVALTSGAGQLAMPIPVQGTTWGVVVLTARQPRVFDGDELTLLEAVAHQMGLAVARASLFADAQAKSRRLETLTRMAQTLAATLSADEVVQRVASAARELFDSFVSRVWLLEPDGEHLWLAGMAGPALPADKVRRMRVGQGLVGTIAATRAPLTIVDVTDDSRTLDTARLRAEGLVSFAGVPLLVGDRVLGALAIAVGERHRYSDEEMDVLRSLGDQAAIALDNARHFAEEQTRHAYLAALLDINKKIGAMASMETLLSSIADEAARLLAVDNAGFRLVEGDELVVAGLAGTAAQTMLRTRIKVGESFSGQVVASGRTLMASIDTLSGLIPEHLAADQRLGYTTYLGVPLSVGERIIGAFTFRARRAFTARDQELAEAFAGQAAIAIEHLRLFEEATRQAARMRALADVGRLFSDNLDPDVVAPRIADSVRTLLGALSSVLFRLDPATQDLRAIAIAGVAERARHDIVLHRGEGAAGLAVIERRPVMSADVAADERLTLRPEMAQWADGAFFGAVLAVPLVVREQIIGALAVRDRVGRVFSSEEIRLAQAFADQAALVLSSAQLYAEATRRRHEAEELARLAQRLTESLDVSDVVERTVESVVPLFGAQSSVLRLLQADGSLVALGVGGRARTAIEPGHILPAGTGVLGRAVAEGRVVWSADVPSDDTVVVSDDLRSVMRTSADGAVLAVPLRAKGLVVGALGIADRPGRIFSEQEGALLQTFADQATLALENARLFSMERARRRQIASLAEIERELAAELDSDRLLHLIVERAASLFSSHGALYVIDGDGTLAARSWTGSPAMPHERLARGQGVAGACAEQRRGLIVNDYARSPHALPSWVAAGLRHTMAQPLLLRGRLLGVIAINRVGAETAPLLAEDLALLESFTAQAAIAIENARLYEAADVRAKRLRTLAHLNHLVSSSLDMAEVLGGIARAAAEFMASPFVGFWVADESTHTLHLRAYSTDLPDEPVTVRQLLFGEGAVGWVAANRRSVSIPEIFTDGRFANREWARARGFTSLFAAPIMHQDSLLGVLMLLGPRPFDFGADELDLLQSFSEQAAAAMRNARLYEEARAYADRLRALEEVNRLVSSSLNTQEVLENLARAIAQFFDAPYASVWAYEPVTRRLRRALTYGDAEVAHAMRDELALGEDAVGWVAEHREPILWTDVETDAKIIDAPQMLRHGLRWITAYPITIGDRLLGAFSVHRAASSPVTPETASLMGSLAAQAAVALENARLYSETSRRLAETRALLEVAEILNSTLDSRQLLKRVAVKVAQVCRVDRCSMELWEGDRVLPLMSQFADGRRAPGLWQAFMAHRPYTPREIPAYARAIETRRPVLIDDTSVTDLIPPEWVAAYGMRSYMVVPLIRHDQVIGVMDLDYVERATPFQDWQQDVALAIAGQLALSLENTRLYAEAQERLRETTILLGVGRVLSQPDAGDDLMRRVAAEVAHAFGSDMTGAYVLDDRKEMLLPMGGYHVPKGLVTPFLSKPIVLAHFPALLAAWRSGRAIWSSDVLGDDRFAEEWKSGLPPLSVLCVPTLAHGEPVGGLFLVWWRTGRVFEPAEIRVLEGVASQVGLAMENAELARQTRLKLAETETLLSASRALSTTLDISGLVRHFLKTVAATVDADCVGSWLMADDGEWMDPLAGYRVPPERLEAFRTFRVSTLKHAFYADAARRKKPVFTSDAMHDARIPSYIREAGPHRSQLFVPVIVKDRMIAGFAAVWWERAREFSDSELALMEAIANQAGVALENARLFDENRRRVEELSVLHDMSREVTGQLDPAALLQAIRRQVARVLDVSNLMIAQREPGAEDVDIVLRLVDGVEDTSVPLRYSPPNASGLTSVVLDTGRPVRTDDYAAECVRHGVVPFPESAELRYWLGVPLTVGDQVFGAIALRGGRRPFTEGDERLLTNIAHLAALALSSARLFEERTRAYGELAAAQDQLVRTEKLRALGEMASGVAHDFNNLLASVLGRAQLLLRRVQEPQLRQWLEVIERSALDGAQTVKRLQEFTRIRRDQPLVPLDLNQVVRDALDITQSRWREEPLSRGISIDVHTALGELSPVVGDPAELREAMTNLILNAVDAMPQGGTLSITTAAVEDRIEVTVADSGVGIPAAVRDKIFDPFFTTKGPQGTGLGLSMTYGIVARHGASISVESEEGRGSAFRIVFPPGMDVAPAPTAPRVDTRPVQPIKCLVVDDEPAVRVVLGDILESAGHTAVVVGDGAEAIARFRDEPFDLVLTDLAMPRVSGWQVARAVKQIAPQVPVFLVTGFGVELTMEERRAHGVDLVLVKPLQIQEILDAVAEVARVRARSGGPEGP